MRKRREPDFTTYILGDPNMNPLDLFNQVKEMIEKKDFDAAKKFVDETKTTSVTTLNKPKGLYLEMKWSAVPWTKSKACSNKTMRVGQKSVIR